MKRHRDTSLDPRRLKALERWYRQVGYQDGYDGKPAASKNPFYGAGYRRGRQARQHPPAG